ncbi:MAG: hypothetical protein R2838_09495 [Caldilineaceae bacterium]
MGRLLLDRQLRHSCACPNLLLAEAFAKATVGPDQNSLTFVSSG